MRVLVALSGGVDSAVAAALLVDAGHDVVGVTMKLWGGESDTGCCSVADVEDARRSAAQLGVEHHVFNFGEEFERHVVEPYVRDHVAGRTPNPCVECNRHLKFDVLLRRAELLGFDAVATGHHARVVRLAEGGDRVARGADRAKDQSYVLYPLTATELASVLLPVGEMTKAEVRRIAAARGLRPADKPDSQDVCFITARQGRSAFLSARAELHRGAVVDGSGATIGQVDAVETVTIGQRRGLELSGGPARRFVTDVDVVSRTVTVGSAQDLLDHDVALGELVWADQPVSGDVAVQCSAHGTVAGATAELSGDGSVVLTWATPQRRVAPGQSVVLYRDLPTADGSTAAVVVGGGIVTSRR